MSFCNSEAKAMPMAPIGHNGQARPLQYNFQSEHCSLDSDYNGMQAVSSVTAPGASDGQVVEKEEKEKEEEEEGNPPPPLPPNPTSHQITTYPTQPIHQDLSQPLVNQLKILKEGSKLSQASIFLYFPYS